MNINVIFLIVTIKRFFHLYHVQQNYLCWSNGIVFGSNECERIKWLPKITTKHMFDVEKKLCVLNKFVCEFNKFRIELLKYINSKEDIIATMSYKALIDHLDASTDILSSDEHNRINVELTCHSQSISSIVKPIKWFGRSEDEFHHECSIDASKHCNVCCICLDRKSIILFLPCSHLICCRQCSTKIHVCPVCREDIYICLSATF